MERTCKRCGKTFTAKASEVARGRGLYCSRKCFHADQVTTVERECKSCGKKFSAEAYQVARGNVLYCSRKCFHASAHSTYRVAGLVLTTTEVASLATLNVSTAHSRLRRAGIKPGDEIPASFFLDRKR